MATLDVSLKVKSMYAIVPEGTPTPVAFFSRPGHVTAFLASHYPDGAAKIQIAEVAYVSSEVK